MTTPVQDLNYTGELYRKGLHLLALAVPLGMAVLGRDLSLGLLVPMALLAVSADVLRVRSARFARSIYRIFGFMMRRKELPPVGGPVVINGATWVLVSAALLTLLFPIRIGVAAFTMFMLGDAVAALVGRRFGRTRWPGGTRTLEGSAGFLAASLLVVAFFPNVVFWIGAISALVACVTEALPMPFNDNLRVPLVAATIIFALEHLVHTLWLNPLP
jgi:dolichol kinase